MDLIFPPSARVSATAPEVIGSAVSSRSIFSGRVNTTELGGDRLAFGISVSRASRRESYDTRAAVRAFLTASQGQSNRAWFGDPGYLQRGSFPANELFTNSNFENGATSWTTQFGSLTVADRIARLSATPDGVGSPAIYQQITATQYAPHVLRTFIADGARSSGVSIGPYLTAGNNSLSGYSTSARGLIMLSAVTDSSSAEPQYPLVLHINGMASGDYASCLFASLTRCMLVDNGQNRLTFSDQFDNAAWTKSGSSVSANATVASDGTTTMDSLVENSSAGEHYVAQSYVRTASAQDYCAYIDAKRVSGTRNIQLLIDDGASNGGFINVNLSNGTSTVSNAGTGTKARGFVTSLGNGIYRIHIVARLPSTTTARLIAYMLDGSNVAIYTGDGTSRIGLWRGGIAPSSVPVRPVLTTTTVSNGTSQTGRGLYVKGLPASSAGLLLMDDRCQIGKQLNILIGTLNSDAAGLGYLECAHPWRSSPSDNAPIIINNPMMYGLLRENTNGWRDSAGHISDIDFVLEDACDS